MSKTFAILSLFAGIVAFFHVNTLEYRALVPVPFLLLAIAFLQHETAHTAMATHATRVKLARSLDQDTISKQHALRMRRWLRKTDKLLCDAREIDPNHEMYVAPRKNAQRAWSVRALDRVCLLAACYPLLSFIVVWLTGQPAMIGGDEVFAAGSLWDRSVLLLYLAFVLWILPHDVLPKGLTIKYLRSGGMLGSLPTEWVRGLSMVVATILAGTLATDFSGAFAYTVIGAVAIAFTGAYISAGTFAISIGGAIACAAVGSITIAVACIVVGGLPFLIATVLVGDRLSGKYFLMAYCAHALIWSVGIYVALATGEDAGELSWMVVFLIIFPIVNAIFDFASVGLTRWTIRAGEFAKARLRYAIYDLVGTAVLFSGVSITLLASMHAADLIAKSGVIDIANFLRELRLHPLELGWIWLVVASTFVPTAVHGALAITSIGESFPTNRARSALGARIRQIDADDDPDIARVRNVLTLYRTAGIGLIVVAICFLGWALWPQLIWFLDSLRYLMEEFAAFIGMDIIPVPNIWTRLL